MFLVSDVVVVNLFNLKFIRDSKNINIKYTDIIKKSQFSIFYFKRLLNYLIIFLINI